MRNFKRITEKVSLSQIIDAVNELKKKNEGKGIRGTAKVYNIFCH